MLVGYLFISLLITGSIGGFYILIKTQHLDLTIEHPAAVAPEAPAKPADAPEKTS